MEDEIGLRKALDTYDELKEEAQLYYNSLNLDKLKLLSSPSLKYALYNANLFKVFENKIESMNINIEKIRENLKKYKGKKIDVNEEMKKIDDISNRLIVIKKEAKEACYIYLEYLSRIAKKFDVLKNDIIKRIYIKSSEEIIIGRIKYYLNYEKEFLIFNDIINQLINLFNN